LLKQRIAAIFLRVFALAQTRNIFLIILKMTRATIMVQETSAELVAYEGRNIWAVAVR